MEKSIEDIKRDLSEKICDVIDANDPVLPFVLVLPPFEPGDRPMFTSNMDLRYLPELLAAMSNAIAESNLAIEPVNKGIKSKINVAGPISDN